MSSVGKTFYYVASHARAMGRYGAPVVVLRWHGSKVQVRFADGWGPIVPGRCLRKNKPRLA